MSNRISFIPHPAMLVLTAESASPILREPEYSRQLCLLVELAERLEADDPDIVDKLIHDVIEGWQNAACRMLEGPQ